LWGETGRFTSGAYVHYAPSLIVDPAHQAAATKLIVGQRLPPQVVLHAVNGRPVELQDLLPADARFKLLIFAGDVSSAKIQERLATAVGAIDETLTRALGSAREKAVTVLTVCEGSLVTFDAGAVPVLPKTHYLK
jgi:phenol 2-monooxygenase